MAGEAENTRRKRSEMRDRLRDTPDDRIIRDLMAKDSWDLDDIVSWGAVTNHCKGEVAASAEVANRLYDKARRTLKDAVGDDRMSAAKDPTRRSAWVVGRENGMELASEMEKNFRALRSPSIEALSEKIAETLALGQERDMEELDQDDMGEGGTPRATYDPTTLDHLVDRYVRQFGLEPEPGKHRFLNYRALRNDIYQLKVFQGMMAADAYTTETLEDLAALLRRFLNPKNYLTKIEAPGEGEVPTEHLILDVQNCFLE